MSPTWEEHKHLVCGVIIVGHQHGEVCAPWSSFAGFVPKLCLELLKCLVQLILSHQVATVMTQLQGQSQLSSEREWKSAGEPGLQHPEVTLT